MSAIDWQAQAQQRLAHGSGSLRPLLGELAQQDVTAIEVEYDGSGQRPSRARDLHRPHRSGRGQRRGPPCRRGYVHVLLEYHQPGWENDEGSFGTVRIDVLQRSVTVEHSTRFTDYHETTIEQAL